MLSCGLRSSRHLNNDADDDLETVGRDNDEHGGELTKGAGAFVQVICDLIPIV